MNSSSDTRALDFIRKHNLENAYHHVQMDAEDCGIQLRIEGDTIFLARDGADFRVWTPYNNGIVTLHEYLHGRTEPSHEPDPIPAALGFCHDIHWDEDGIPDLTYTDQIEAAAAAHEKGQTVEVYTINVFDERGYIDSAKSATLLWLPDSEGNRAAVAWGADSEWFDAETPEDAVELWRTGQTGN